MEMFVRGSGNGGGAGRARIKGQSVPAYVANWSPRRQNAYLRQDAAGRRRIQQQVAEFNRGARAETATAATDAEIRAAGGAGSRGRRAARPKPRRRAR